MENAIALKRAEIEAAGIELTDLTDTNPTRHNLLDPAVLEIIAEHLPGASRYEPHPRGPWPARAALAERYGGDPEDYWLCASTSEAYGWLFSLLAGAGKAVAVPSPGYPLIEPLAQYRGVSTRDYRSFYAHPSGWELDRTSLEQTLAEPDVRAVVAIHPNNPTGAYQDPIIAQLAHKQGLPLIADEVFFPYQFEDPLSTDIKRLSGNDQGITFGLEGLSKLLAAPQLKLAWIRLSGPPKAKPAIAKELDQIADAYLSVNTPVALALPDLLEIADDTVARVLTRVKTNLATAKEVLIDRRIWTAQGGWMMLMDIPSFMEADKLCIALMEWAGLYVHPGYFYDLPDSVLAISLLPAASQFRESCERLVAALAVLGNDPSPRGR